MREQIGLCIFIGHFKTITRHKILVAKGCFKLGLYYQGIMHDMSKYSPTEFLVGVKYYQGTESPNNAERMEEGISMSWLHHKGRNKHHFEYWIDYSIDKDHPGLVGMKIPKKYMAEMFVDRVSAGRFIMEMNSIRRARWNILNTELEHRSCVKHREIIC